MSKITMIIKLDEYNEPKWNKTLKYLQDNGWILDKDYGGILPNFTGHSAELHKD